MFLHELSFLLLRNKILQMYISYYATSSSSLTPMSLTIDIMLTHTCGFQSDTCKQIVMLLDLAAKTFL